MSKETFYPLTESEANAITNAVQRGYCRMIAIEDLMDLPVAADSFGNNLEGILGTYTLSPNEPPLEIQKENAYRWLVKHYELISATFTAVRELVDDTRNGLEMLPTRNITEHFLQARKERQA